MGKLQPSHLPPSLPEAEPAEDGREVPGLYGPARRHRGRPREREGELGEVPTSVSKPTMFFNIILDSNFISLHLQSFSKFAVIGACPKNQAKIHVRKKMIGLGSDKNNIYNKGVFSFKQLIENREAITKH